MRANRSSRQRLQSSGRVRTRDVLLLAGTLAAAVAAVYLWELARRSDASAEIPEADLVDALGQALQEEERGGDSSDLRADAARGQPRVCDAHAAMYANIHNDLIPWRSRGIRRSDFKLCPREYGGMIGFLHFAVLHDELYVLGPPMPDWVNGLYFLTLAEIQEVVYAGGIPNMQFAMQFSDWPSMEVQHHEQGGKAVPLGREPLCPMFSWVKARTHYDILIPDGDFLKHHFDDWLANSTAHDPGFSTPWAQKEPRAVGRYTNFPTGRRAKSKRGQAVVPRNYYSALSDATNRTLLEVGMVEDRGWLPIREQLAYKYALSVDGNTASTRLAMLLASDQTAMKHVSDYYMFYESGLVPWVHYVPFGEYDKDDVLPIVEWLRDHDDVAHRIALEGQRFAARHLTKPARLCYLRKLLTEYGSLFKFVPQLSDFHPDVALFTDEIRRYNDSVRFHTPHGANYMEFFRRKDGGEWRVPERIATPIAGDPGYVMPRPA